MGFYQNEFTTGPGNLNLLPKNRLIVRLKSDSNIIPGTGVRVDDRLIPSLTRQLKRVNELKEKEIMQKIEN